MMSREREETEYPDPDSGLMRGYLYADVPGGTFWFVLSNGHLSYFESQEKYDMGQAPMGMLRLDELKAVKGDALATRSPPLCTLRRHR